MTKGSGNDVVKLLVLGIVFHVVFIASVFDCYFTSPIVHGMNRYGDSLGEAKRVVLIVADGLRADLVFTPNGFPFSGSSPAVVAPYLRSIVTERGAFGVSHTRVPTESRPGHVAIIGGIYEDVSAVTKGWKTNPVDFDSVFNRSSHTFSFGSPDILPMFAKGATPGKVRTWCYDAEDEDFTKDATSLDLWVLDQLRTLFHNASTDVMLNSHLREDKVVFFLHLIGLDMTGHAYRPHSEEYMKNIQVVDDIVGETEKLLSQFYGDDETSFVFTADHGMSKIGNHGDGDPDNSRTPLVAWGRGIRGPLPDSHPSSHDEYSRPWDLDHLFRRDVSQADLTPLMASLIGIDWPVNTVGVLPDIDPTRAGYLLPREGEETLARQSLTNAQVLLDHYRVKRDMKASRVFFYKPFRALEDDESGKPRRISKIDDIKHMIQERRWYEARRLSSELVASCLDGLRYLETYDRLLIRAIVIVAYFGWAAYASISLLPPAAPWSDFTERLIDTITLITLLSFWIAFWLQKSPWTLFIYVSFPCFFWREFFSRGLPAITSSLSLNRRSCVQGLLTVFALQSMVVAYTHRSMWSLGFVVIGTLWPFCTWPSSLLSGHRRLVWCWNLSCWIIGIFPLLPVDRKESLSSILAGGTVTLLMGAIHLRCSRTPERSAKTSAMIQMSMVAASMLVTCSSVMKLQAKHGLPRSNQVAAWTLLVLSSIYPFVSKARYSSSPTSKIMSFFLAFAVCFVVLSISVEGLFYSAFTCNLLLWIEVETLLRRAVAPSECTSKQADQSKHYHFRVEDIRIALFFLFYVQVAFFGTGNVASISSFYLEPVYRLVPIFNPFLMASLLIFKIVCPYVILSAVLATLHARLNLPPFSLFFVALTLTDGMTVTFFLNVTDTGSWLEIGQSISFFCITSLLLVWSAGICATGEHLMGNTLVHLKASKLD